MTSGSAPCCSACASNVRPTISALALRDPLAIALDAHAHGRGIGDLIPTFVFPADIKAYKAKLDPHFKATNADVAACKTVPPRQAQGWADFFTSWRAFVDGGTNLLSSWTAQLDEAKRFEKELADWQALLAETCKLSTPPIDVPGKPFPTGAVLLLGGALVVVAALGYSFYKTGKQAGARAQQGRRYLEGQIDRRLASGEASGKALARR